MKIIVFGASGRTGIQLLQQALAAGHQVTAFVRNPGKISLAHANLLLVQGDVTDAAAVDRAVAGQEAVLSALGPAKGNPPQMLTQGVGHILAAMKRHGVRRYVGLTGAGVAAPGDPPSLGRTIMLSLLKLLAKSVLEDSENSVRQVRESGLDWTILRAPVLTEGPLKGEYRTGILKMGPGARISRADVAHSMLKALTDPATSGTMPMITY